MIRTVLYVLTEFPTDSETFVLNEIRGLRELGVEIRHVLSLRRPTSRRLPPVGLDVLVPPAWWCTLPFLLALTLRHPGRLASLLIELWREHKGERFWSRRGATSGLKSLYLLPLCAWTLRQANFGHVHAHFAGNATSAARQLAIMAGTRYSFTGHGSDILLYPPQGLARRIQQAAFFVTVSNHNLEQIRQHHPGLQDATCAVIPCGIPMERFARARRERGPHLRRMVTVARLDPVKALYLPLRALAAGGAELADLHYTIVGEGPERNRLEAEIRDLALTDRVELAGLLGPDEVVQRLREADLFLLSSLSEGFPVVLMEAAAAHLPMVATKITAVPDIVQDGVNGRLVPPGDPEALRNVLLELVRNPDSFGQLCRGASALEVAQWDEQTTLGRLKDLFTNHALS
jgi:colanic acid/amylovoran biosynthesis glycosyltransferase